MAYATKSKENTLPIFIVDAFTNRPFRGNGAAVCLLHHQVVPDDVKQKMAAEMNLSETAFISLIGESDTFEKGRSFSLRWFTPTCEVPLCGHATLASATVLFSVYNNPSPVLEFETASGTLRAKRSAGGRKIEIDLPAYESKPVEFKKYEDVVKAAAGCLPVQDVVLSESGKLLVRLTDNVTRQQLEGLRPRDAELTSAADVVGVIVTLRGSGKADCTDEERNAYDFVSRYFAPRLGVSEDPVTGSAHSVLAPHWSRVLNKTELYARQCSVRGGDLSIRVSGDRVLIGGESVVVVRGQIDF